MQQGRRALLTMSVAAALVACGSEEPRDDMEGLSVYDTPDEAANSPFSEMRSSETRGAVSDVEQSDDYIGVNSDSGEDIIARAVLNPTEGNDVEGTIRFQSLDAAVQMQVNIRGLATGPHGIHIHENGDCSAPDASSAGGHFSPSNDPHGAPAESDEDHHAGDLGNIRATTAGLAEVNRQYEAVSLSGENSIIGKAVIIHADRDDLNTQPAGDSGSRVACGIIEVIPSSVAVND